jgi:hypothetical protein
MRLHPMVTVGNIDCDGYVAVILRVELHETNGGQVATNCTASQH